MDPPTDEFDPNRFGKINFTTRFFKKLITTPLPEPNEEDLVNETLGEGPTAEEARDAVARLKAFDPHRTDKKKVFWTPAELRALGQEPKRRRGILILLGGVAVVALLVWRVSWNESSTVAPDLPPTDAVPQQPSTAIKMPEATRSPKQVEVTPKLAVEPKMNPARQDSESIGTDEPKEAMSSPQPTSRMKPEPPPPIRATTEPSSPPVVEEKAAEPGEFEAAAATSTPTPKPDKPRFGPKQ